LLSENPKEIKSRQTFQHGNIAVEYILIQSKRRKTCEVTVDKDGITIGVPFDKPMKEIDQILNDKIKWISQKQREMQNEKPGIIKPSFEEKPTLSCLGKNYNLKIIDTTDKLEKRLNLMMIFLLFILVKKN
jgi:predicted metal-dependent hydrolase